VRIWTRRGDYPKLAGAIRVRAVWTAVGRFERLIGGEALRVAARRAEAG
jgi:hypothetical protein